MPQRANNFLEVLARAAGKGLDYAGQNYAADKQQKKQNQMADLGAMMEILQGQQAYESNRQANLLGQLKLKQVQDSFAESRRRLDLTAEQRKAEDLEKAKLEGEIAAAKEIGQIQSFAGAVQPALKAFPGVRPTMGQAAGIIGGQLPAGATYKAGPLSLQGPKLEAPMSEKDRAQIELYNAQRDKYLAEASGGDKNLSVSELNREDKQRISSIVAGANNWYEDRFDEKERSRLGVQSITSRKDIVKILDGISKQKKKAWYEKFFGGADIGERELAAIQKYVDQILKIESGENQIPIFVPKEADAWGTNKYPDWDTLSDEAKIEVWESEGKK